MNFSAYNWPNIPTSFCKQTLNYVPYYQNCIFCWLWRCQFRRNIKWLLVKTLKLQIRPINFKIWGIWVHFLKTKKCITGLLSLEPRGGNINRSRICCHNFPGWNNINSCSNISSFISFFLSLKMSSVANRSKNFTKPKGQCDPVQFFLLLYEIE